MDLEAVHGTVVVAEARDAVRDYVRGVLERALPGVSQVSACSGAAALDVLDSLATLAPSERGPVVLLVSAARISDGLAVAAHAWASPSSVSVVLVGRSSAEDRARARLLEAALIDGPEGFARLAHVVARLLRPPTIH